jgi:hypothetical protein
MPHTTDDDDVTAFRVFSRIAFAPARRELANTSGPVFVGYYKAQNTAARKTMLRWCRAERMKLLSRTKDETDGRDAEMLTVYRIRATNFFWLKIAMSAEDDVVLVTENLDRIMSDAKCYAHEREARLAAHTARQAGSLAQHQADEAVWAAFRARSAVLDARIAELERVPTPLIP